MTWSTSKLTLFKMRFEGEPIVSDMEKKLAKGWDTEIEIVV